MLLLQILFFALVIQFYIIAAMLLRPIFVTIEEECSEFWEQIHIFLTSIWPISFFVWGSIIASKYWWKWTIIRPVNRVKEAWKDREDPADPPPSPLPEARVVSEGK